MDKKFCIISLFIPLFIGLLAILLLYIYDPFLLYHKPYFRDLTFSNNVRVQAKGVIKHYDFNSYILGTSAVANTSAKEAGEKLGGKWVNLSLLGGTLKERALILNYAFKKRNVESLILSFDRFDLLDNNIDFAFLYDENEFDDLRIYFSWKFLKRALRLSKSENTIKDLEDMASFRDDKMANARFGGIQNWFKDYKRVRQLQLLQEAIETNNFKKLEKIEALDVSKYKENINENLLFFIKNYPNTNFYICLPPYSRLYHNIYRLDKNRKSNSEAFYTLSTILTWFLKELESYPNAKVYGFDTLDYADNIANYSDLVHYNKSMNSMQLDAILNNTNILTSDNIKEYLRIMEEKIQNYNVESLIKMAKEALRK